MREEEVKGEEVVEEGGNCGGHCRSRWSCCQEAGAISHWFLLPMIEGCEVSVLCWQWCPETNWVVTLRSHLTLATCHHPVSPSSPKYWPSVNIERHSSQPHQASSSSTMPSCLQDWSSILSPVKVEQIMHKWLLVFWQPLIVSINDGFNIWYSLSNNLLLTLVHQTSNKHIDGDRLLVDNQWKHFLLDKTNTNRGLLMSFEYLFVFIHYCIKFCFCHQITILADIVVHCPHQIMIFYQKSSMKIESDQQRFILMTNELFCWRSEWVINSDFVRDIV